MLFNIEKKESKLKVLHFDNIEKLSEGSINMKNIKETAINLMYVIGIDPNTNEPHKVAYTDMWCPVYMKEYGDYFCALAGLEKEDMDPSSSIYGYNTGITKADIVMAEMVAEHTKFIHSDTFYFIEYIRDLVDEMDKESDFAPLHNFFASVSSREMVEKWLGEAKETIGKMEDWLNTTMTTDDIDGVTDTLTQLENYFNKINSMYTKSVVTNRHGKKFYIDESSNKLVIEYKKGKSVNFFEPSLNSSKSRHMISSTPNHIKQIDDTTYIVSSNHVKVKIEIMKVQNPYLSNRRSSNPTFHKISVPVITEVLEYNNNINVIEDLINTQKLFEFDEDGKSVLYGLNIFNVRKLKTIIQTGSNTVTYPDFRFMPHVNFCLGDIKLILNRSTWEIGLISVEEGMYNFQSNIRHKDNLHTEELVNGKMTYDSMDFSRYDMKIWKYDENTYEHFFHRVDLPRDQKTYLEYTITNYDHETDTEEDIYFIHSVEKDNPDYTGKPVSRLSKFLARVFEID